MKNKVVVVGLDGATWSVIDRFISKGYLPTLKKLKEAGTYGELKSTIPPVSAPAWMSLATGKNPGKTGVFDFFNKNPGTYELKSANSSFYRRASSVWDYLSHYGKRSVIISYPMLYPPYEINGLAISGIPSPSDENITYPKSLKERLDKITGGYQIDVQYHDVKYDDRTLFFRDLERVVDNRIKVVLDLLDEEWDLFFAVFSCTDWLQHSMWGVEEEYMENIAGIWSKLDDTLAKIIKQVKSKANILVVSDHGFGPQKGVFNLPGWLVKKGYMKLKEVKGYTRTLEMKGYRRIRKWISAAQKLRNRPFYKLVRNAIPRVLRKGALNRVEEKLSIEIDYSRSRAYVCKHSIPFGGIYLNLKGRDPQGIVETAEKKSLKEQIKKDLYDIPRDLGIDISVSVYDTEEIYWGELRETAPDIIFTLNNWGCVVNQQDYEEEIYINESYSNRHVGSHRPYGIFLAYGEDIKEGFSLSDAKIFDIMPTIVEMIGLPLPKGTDGNVLEGIFKQPPIRNRSYNHATEKARIIEKIKRLKDKGKI